MIIYKYDLNFIPILAYSLHINFVQKLEDIIRVYKRLQYSYSTKYQRTQNSPR